MVVVCDKLVMFFMTIFVVKDITIDSSLGFLPMVEDVTDLFLVF